VPSTLVKRDRDPKSARGRGGKGERKRSLTPAGDGARGEDETSAGDGGEGDEGDAGAARRGDEAPTEGRLFVNFLIVWTLLNVCLNARYPSWRVDDPHHLWLLPSPDVTGIFAVFCLFGWRRRRVPASLMGTLVALIIAMRFLRVGDGITWRYLYRPFSIVSDAPLIGELVRLLWTTAAHWQVVVGLVAFGAALVGLGFGVRFALRHAEAYLARPAGRAAFLGVVGLFLGLSWAVPKPAKVKPVQRLGMFGTSAVAHLALETDTLLHLVGLRRQRWEPLNAASARVEALPTSLPALGGADVFLFFIESYGHVVVSEPEVRGEVEQAWARFSSELEAAGYGIRSSWLVSPTCGGGSWLAHSSLASGTKVIDQFSFDLLTKSAGKSMPWAMRRAGYRTLLVAPATTGVAPIEKFYDFDKVYHSADFDYRGPRFSWATMPDQFVVDLAHRREIEGHKGPLFTEYMLISSHAPFDTQPAYIHDWSTLGDGSIYRDLVPITYPGLDWRNQQFARAAYARSLAYDFQVLSHYLTNSVQGDPLIILLGDHQPVPELSDHDPEWSVPIHIVSRRREFLAPFERRGYGVGMNPAGEPRGIETFLFTFFEDFSAQPPAQQ
jgi:hypothetical protein